MKRIAWVVAITALLAAPAHAGGDSTVVLVNGPTDDITMVGVRASAEARLTDQAVTVVQPAVEIKAGALAICSESDDACRKKALATSGADRALMILVEQGKDKEGEPLTVITASLYDVATGAHIASEQRFCTRCTAVESLDGSVRDAVAGVEKNVAALAGATATLILQSVPPGATVSVDDQTVGVTDTQYKVYAGTHLVRLDLEGY